MSDNNYISTIQIHNAVMSLTILGYVQVTLCRYTILILLILYAILKKWYIGIILLVAWNCIKYPE